MESMDTPAQHAPVLVSTPRRPTGKARDTAAPELNCAVTTLPSLKLPSLSTVSTDIDPSTDQQTLAQMADLLKLEINNPFSHILKAHTALQKKITQLSFSDSLTGLKNRPALLISLQRAIDKSREQQNYSAVLLVDIDDFKSHNVHLGHMAGDMLLQQCAQRLTLELGPNVAIARLFADKFLIVLEEMGATREEAAISAQRIATRVSNCFDDAFNIAAAAVPLCVSIGLCLIGMQDTITTDVLIDRAELVTDNAKQAGGNCMFSFEFGAMEKGGR